MYVRLSVMDGEGVRCLNTYHHYLYEQGNGRLPEHFPKLVLHYTADLELKPHP